jgi:hypothetical protein
MVADVQAIFAARVDEMEVIDFTDRLAIRTCPDLRLLVDYMPATEGGGMLPYNVSACRRRSSTRLAIIAGAGPSAAQGGRSTR